MSLQDVQDEVSNYMDKILKLFKPGKKITVLVRAPGEPEQDFSMSSDTGPEIEAMIARRFSTPSLPKPEARPEGEAAGFRKMSRPDKSRMYWAIFPHVPNWGPFIVAHISGEMGTIIEDKVGWVRLSKVKNYPHPHGWSLYWIEPSEILFGAEVSPAAPEASIWDAETIKDAPEANDARVYQFDSGYGNGFGNMLVTKSDCLRILAELQARGGPGYEIMVKVPNPIRFFGPHSQPPAPSTTEKEG